MLGVRSAFYGTIVLVAMLVVLTVVGFRDPVAPSGDVSDRVGQTMRIRGIAVSVDARSTDHRVTLETSRGRILARLPLREEVAVGDQVQVTCEIERPRGDEDFRYDRYLALQDVFSLCKYPSSILVTRHEISFASVLSDVRRVLTRSLEHALPEPESALASGLLFGSADGMSAHTKELFRQTGTSHIVAASGYNVAVVAAMVLATFSSLGVHRKVAIGMVIASIVAYVLLAGAESSLLRAGVMGVVLVLCKHTGRAVFTLNVVLLAAILLAWPRPQVLWDDVGFQLSFAAVAGLLWIAPRLERRIQWIPSRFGLRTNASATISATLATAPITWITFGTIALRGVWVNALVLPLIPFAMATSALVSLLVAVGAPKEVGLMAWFPLHLMLEMIRWSAFV